MRRKKKRKGVGHSENDDLDWTEKVMRKREREGEKVKHKKRVQEYMATRSNLRDGRKTVYSVEIIGQQDLMRRCALMFLGMLMREH